MTKAIGRNHFFKLLQKECNKRIIKYYMKQHKDKMGSRFKKPTKIDVFSAKSFISLPSTEEEGEKIEPEAICLLSS